MRKQIAAANWKMNGNKQEAGRLLGDILNAQVRLREHHQAIFAVPFPFLAAAGEAVSDKQRFDIAAQNCHHQASGAYTGEVSAEMLQSIGIRYCLVGHSERREYFHETGAQLADKINILLKHDMMPIFCCGEPLQVREANQQEIHVRAQIEESLFHLSDRDISRIIIAYEPVWAIGTGKTATTEQAQQMHEFIRSVLSSRYGTQVAGGISILYGGSVKASNAAEIFGAPDVDGGLVGGASLVAADFIRIIQSLKS